MCEKPEAHHPRLKSPPKQKNTPQHVQCMNTPDIVIAEHILNTYRKTRSYKLKFLPPHSSLLLLRLMLAHTEYFMDTE